MAQTKLDGHPSTVWAIPVGEFGSWMIRRQTLEALQGQNEYVYFTTNLCW